MVFKMVIIFMLLLLFSGSRCKSINYKQSSTFTLDSTWPDPQTVQFLPVHGSAVAVDKNRNVIVLHRGTFKNQKINGTKKIELIEEDVVFVLSSTTGKVLARWGANKFAKPHGIEVDGKDIFVTDVIRHQVFKFAHDSGTRTWKQNADIELGEAFTSGNDPFHFCSPADVGVSRSTGEFYVADGYCNSRIVKFSKRGIYRGEFTAATSNSHFSTQTFDFNVTHSVTIAEPPPLSQYAGVFGRIQTFLGNGTFLYEIPYPSFGATKEMLLAVTFFPTKNWTSLQEPFGTLFAISGHLPIGKSMIFEILVGQNGYHFRNMFPFTNVYKLTEFNNRSSNTKERLNGLETPHDIAISEDGKNLYVIESNQKLIIRKFIKSGMRVGSSSSRCNWNCVLCTVCTVNLIYSVYLTLRYF